MTNGESLITRYRPATFEEVQGHDSQVAALNNVLSYDDSHAFLITGPSGVGKTTIARIVANKVECSPQDLFEIDAATNTGIDDMRAVTNAMSFRSLVGTPKVVIIDEAHRLSPQAWSGILKAVEEPGNGYWILCTTDAAKVPPTIKTRCTRIDLRPVNRSVLEDYLEKIASIEQMDVSADTIRLVVKESNGSVRKALVDLAIVAGCDNSDAVKTVLAGTDDMPPGVIDLCRYLVKAGPSGNVAWGTCMKYIEAIKDQDPEGVRLAVLAYFTKVAMGSNGAKLMFALTILDNLSTPCDRSTKMASIIVGLGHVIFDEG